MSSDCTSNTRKGHATSVRLLCHQRLCRGHAASVALVPRERLRSHDRCANRSRNDKIGSAGKRLPRRQSRIEMKKMKGKGQSMEKEVRVRVPQVKDLEAAIRMFYEKSAFGNKDIMEMFGVSASTADRLKKLARMQEEEEGIQCRNTRFVNPDAAFRAWSLDIGRMEASLKRLRELKIYKEAE